jgi:hypothetical protein
MADKPLDPFTDLLTHLVRVPKEKIDEKEREYQEQREDAAPAKAGEMIPGTKVDREAG